MAEETVSAEQSMEQELEALLSPKSAAPAAELGKGGAPKPGEQKPPVASPAASETPEVKEGETPAEEQDPLLKALDEIKDDEEPEVKKDEGPKLSDEQQQILRAIPDATTAAQLYNTAQNYHNFTGALENGKFEDVQNMLKTWNPDVLDGWLEHVYKTHVASGEWVDRFIAEQEGRAPEHKGMKKLEKEVQQLKSALAEKQTNSAQDEQTKLVQQSFVNYKNHVDGLFDQINFNKADRKWVAADLNTRVAADPKILAAIRGGNVTAVNKLFKVACREYVSRDKEVSTETETKIVAQTQKKLPLAGGTAEVSTDLPDDVRQVKKGQEETWLDQQLGKLFSKKKK